MKKPRTNKSDGTRASMDPNRKRWMQTDTIDFVHVEIPDGKHDIGEGSLEGWGETHFLSMFGKRNTTKNFSIDLSAMSLEEIQALKEFIDKVFAEAQEVCEHRDKQALEAFQHGNDAHYRLYRQVPHVVERKGARKEHDTGEGS